MSSVLKLSKKSPADVTASWYPHVISYHRIGQQQIYQMLLLTITLLQFSDIKVVRHCIGLDWMQSNFQETSTGFQLWWVVASTRFDYASSINRKPKARFQEVTNPSQGDRKSQTQDKGRGSHKPKARGQEVTNQFEAAESPRLNISLSSVPCGGRSSRSWL